MRYLRMTLLASLVVLALIVGLAVGATLPSFFSATALAQGGPGGGPRMTPVPGQTPLPWPGRTPGPGNPGYGMMGGGLISDTVSSNVTTLLGLTLDQIRADRQAGRSLAQIAAERNVTEDQLVEAIFAPMEARHEQMHGDIPNDPMETAMEAQIRADVRQTAFPTHTDALIGLVTNYGGWRGMMGPGMMRWNVPANNTTPGTAPQFPGFFRGMMGRFWQSN